MNTLNTNLNTGLNKIYYGSQTKKMYEWTIMIRELSKAIKKSKLRKMPGPDRLQSVL